MTLIAARRQQSRRANRTYQGARREKSHPRSDRFAVTGRLALGVLRGRWPQSAALQPHHQAVPLALVLLLAFVS